MKWSICILAIGALATFCSAQECGGNVTVTAGNTIQVVSPGYPESYPNNADCLWRVHAPDLSKLSIICPQVDLQWTIFGCVDTLSFSDAENFNQMPSYCGNKKPPAELLYGDTAYLRFLSDGTFTDNGFVCNITAKEASDVDEDCNCGKELLTATEQPKFSEKVYNGAQLRKHQYPWLAIIMLPDSAPKVLCMGTLINSHYVLTSARCILGVTPESVRIRVGEHDLMNNNETPPHKIYDIEAIKIHPNFNSSNLRNDLALIRLGEQVLYEPNIYPACLPKGEVVFDNQTKLIAAGWGASGANTDQVTLPRGVLLDPLTDLAACSAKLPTSLAVGEGQVCTTAQDGSDVCANDFGTPLVQDINGIHYISAISSFNIECGSQNGASVHSRIDYHLSWILAASADAVQCGTATSTATPKAHH